MKLEDIPKKPIFDIPEGYFERLPNRIQSRIAEGGRSEFSFVYRYRLQYVIPAAFFIAVLSIWLLRPQAPTDAESILATVDTEQLVAYLNESEISTEDVLEEFEFSPDDVEDIEAEVYQLQLEDEFLDELLEDVDVENM